jgi:hypothetical protein
MLGLKKNKLLATVEASALSQYEPLATSGALLVPDIPRDHLLVLIAFAHSGALSQVGSALDKDALSRMIGQIFNQYHAGKLSIEKRGDAYRLYEA